jgi:hypothetical protein
MRSAGGGGQGAPAPGIALARPRSGAKPPSNRDRGARHHCSLARGDRRALQN